MSAKRILLVTDIFPPDVGGPATFVSALAAELHARGFAVTVVCQTDPVSHSPPMPHAVRRFARHGGEIGKANLLGGLYREALRHDYVFTNGLESFTELACRLARRPYTLKVVGDLAWERARLLGLTKLSVDEFQQQPSADKRTRQWIERRKQFSRRARQVIVPSQYLRQMVMGWGVPASRLVVVPNGVPLRDFEPYAPRQRHGGIFRIAFVGRLVNWKGIDVLLNAASQLSNVQLDIIGGGPQEGALRAIAAELRLTDRVQFAGSLARDHLLARMAQAHVLVLPSEYEGLSHTLIEACAAGVPCIATSCGGNPEVISHGVNGLLVPFGDVAALRDALARVQGDEVLRLQLANAAKAQSRDFDFQNTVAQTIAVIAR